MTKCNKINIPKDCCYIKFKKGICNHSQDIGYTNRGEQVFIDFNKKKEIIGIELIGSKQVRKSCQESNNNEKRKTKSKHS